MDTSTTEREVKSARDDAMKLAAPFQAFWKMTFFDVPLAVCMERNSKRDRAVTDEVMLKMGERLRPPTFKEGFDKITVVRVKGQPGSEGVGSPGAAAAGESADPATSV